MKTDLNYMIHFAEVESGAYAVQDESIADLAYLAQGDLSLHLTWEHISIHVTTMQFDSVYVT